MILRPGDWRPGATSPALLAVQLLTTSQAALRGLGYLRDGIDPRGPVALAELTASPPLWGALFLGTSLAVLAGIAGRWAGVLVVAHLLLGSVYLGLGIAVLVAVHAPTTLLALSLVCAAGGCYVIACPRWTSLTVRLVWGLGLLLTAAVGVSADLGAGSAPGTGLAIGGLIQVALAGGVFVASTRTRLAVEVEREGVREVAHAR